MNLGQGVLTTGLGSIKIGKNIRLGISHAPYAYSTYIHLNARTEMSFIIIEDEVAIKWTP